jgi:hypothetical protein
MANPLEQNIGKAGDSPVENSQLSAKTFSDPKDFLNTLQTHFKELSRGDDKLSLANLQLDTKDASLDNKTRAAASVAAEHFSDLAGIYGHQNFGSQENSKGISACDVKFANDMNDHNTKLYTAEKVGNDLYIGAMFGAAGALEIAAGEVLPIGIPLGAATLAYAGYAGYNALTESSNMNSIADKDSAEFRGWTQT